MRLFVSLFTLVLIIYFISDPKQALQDITLLIHHALPFVKQAIHNVLNFLQNARR